MDDMPFMEVFESLQGLANDYRPSRSLNLRN